MFITGQLVSSREDSLRIHVAKMTMFQRNRNARTVPFVYLVVGAFYETLLPCSPFHGLKTWNMVLCIHAEIEVEMY
jgi:hypothetical protein